ncbi:MAG: PHP domain-containing protein [Coriobacteriales bacterium]|jgi:predicted metal-dependent phosphoesterase TrpH|nr:PHP domain-containing protein [Coriobacteriales bacterium]
MLTDLHIHTTISDGSESFEQVLRQASQLGIGQLAFTNHDTLRGLSDAFELGERFGIAVIGGVELSAWDSNAHTKVHVLGLGLASEYAPAISELCEPLLERRRANARWQIEQLRRAGMAFDPGIIERLAAESTSIYSQHIMAALTRAPYTSRVYNELYRMLFKGKGICARDISYLDPVDAVRAIKESGALAILAHPGRYQNFELVPTLVAAGLDGIEKYHPDHGPLEWYRAQLLADRFGLICTGGSDYHGSFGESPGLGSYRLKRASRLLRPRAAVSP